MLIHLVKEGESLWQIASLYRVPPGSISSTNMLPDPNIILAGQALIIPTEDTLHSVKRGETLWSIAQKYGIGVQSVIMSNRIPNPSYIYPGMRLHIPAMRHTVMPGETLSQIAARYGTAAGQIADANGIKDPNLIIPGTVLVIPRIRKTAVDVNGYIYIYGSRAASIVNEYGRHLTYLSPFAYRIREDGSLEPIDDTPAVNAAIAQKAVPMMSITNFTSTELGHNLAHLVLSSAEIQNTLFANMIGIMRKKGYRGVNIDFENVLPEDRVGYNTFLSRAVDRLHSAGYFVSTALAPKTGPEQQGLLYTAHDYPAHGRIVDFVVLMTYEWGYRLGPPQAISPLNRIKQVLDYAVSVIPRDKIMFGFQLYARDWLLPHVQGQEAETFSIQDALRKAVKYRAVISYDSTAESPFFRYKDESGRMHEVWFEDARSTQAKFDAVKDYGLRGISYWSLGYPFPENWALLEDNFTIKKLM